MVTGNISDTQFVFQSDSNISYLHINKFFMVTCRPSLTLHDDRQYIWHTICFSIWFQYILFAYKYIFHDDSIAAPVLLYMVTGNISATLCFSIWFQYILFAYKYIFHDDSIAAPVLLYMVTGNVSDTQIWCFSIQFFHNLFL